MPGFACTLPSPYLVSVVPSTLLENDFHACLCMLFLHCSKNNSGSGHAPSLEMSGAHLYFVQKSLGTCIEIPCDSDHTRTLNIAMHLDTYEVSLIK